MTELETNYSTFTASWKTNLQEVLIASEETADVFLLSYKRMATLRAWHEYVVAVVVNNEAEMFFCEALNDLLSSHALAQCGSRRVALKSLRSAIENTLYMLYYKDHPVEYELWKAGSHRLGFSELLQYMQAHPSLAGVEASLNGLQLLKQEYATLSRAVHGGRPFRMTAADVGTNIWEFDRARIGMWSTREGCVVRALNQALLSIYKEHLQGTANRNLRELLGTTVFAGSAWRDKIREGFGVVIPQPQT